ncbi:MAG: hypothetical protein JSS34_08520 [Proteobacteria bacterium]|nr:hypothetical protein [Pseudomonadota bacterium]
MKILIEIKKSFSVAFFLAFTLISCVKAKETSDEWAHTSAKVLPAEGGYIVEYMAPESTAINKEKKEIKGPIQQLVLEEDRRPVLPQEIKLKYLKEEPIIFTYEEPIKFENKDSLQ